MSSRLTKKFEDNSGYDVLKNSSYYDEMASYDDCIDKLGKIEDLMDEYNIKDIKDLEELFEDFVKAGEILYECPNCKCRTVRETDRYCPECGGRIDD